MGVARPLGVPTWKRGNWGQECDSLLYLVIALREQRNIYRIQCFEISFGKNHALDVHLTYKDVDRTRDGTVHELSCLKAWQMSTVHARSYERTHEPCRSSKLRKHRQKIDDYWKTNHDAKADANTSDVEKIRNRHKQNFVDEANNMQFDKDKLCEATCNNYCLTISWLFCLFTLCSISLLVKSTIWYCGTKLV